MTAVFARVTKAGRRYSSQGGHRNRELLTSVMDADGVWHASYKSARRTLCGRLVSERSFGSQPLEPTCADCVSNAVAMDQIDGSVPMHWRGESA